MRKLIFAKKINGTDETGLIDIAKNPPELFCLCEEDKANEILNLNKALVSGSLGFDEGYSKGYSDAQREAAQEIREHYHPNDR